MSDYGVIVGVNIGADGWVGLQIDGYGEKKASIPFGEPCFPLGIYGAPHDPELDPDGAPLPARGCGAEYHFDGSDLQVTPLIDPRDIAALPSFSKGTRFFYGGRVGAPSYIRIDGDTGAVTGFVPTSAATWVHDDSGLKFGNPDAAIPVALADPVVAYLTALEALLTALATAIDVKVPLTPPGAPIVPAVAAFIAAGAPVRALMAAKLVKGF